MKERSRGFSLLEVLIAMSLFLVLGTSLVALLSRALDLLGSGAGGTEVQDKARDFFMPFEKDAKNVAVERRLEPATPDIRFQCDLVPFDGDGDGEVDTRAQRLVYVRSTNRESYDKVAREQALGGLEEVMWVSMPVPVGETKDIRRVGLMELYRITRAPVGGAGSLLEANTAAELQGLFMPEDASRTVAPFMRDVLYFGVEFLGAGGEWVRFWDSTRSLEPDRNLDFKWHVGPDSFKDARDDISPRAMRVTFVYERTGEEVETAYLLEDIDEDATEIRVSDTEMFAGAEAPYVKVGTEWMRYAGDVEDGKVAIAERGARGTVAEAHLASRQEPVRVGYTVERTVLLPCYNEDWDTRSQ